MARAIGNNYMEEEIKKLKNNIENLNDKNIQYTSIIDDKVKEIDKLKTEINKLNDKN